MNEPEGYQEPCLVTGCARSGTSMVAGVINLCGAWGGKMSGPNRHNEKGMFENSTIRDSITKPYLREIGVDPLGQFPLPDTGKILIPANWRVKILQVLHDQGYPGGPWFYKGAKMCLMWPVWHFAFPTSKWVIVRRKTADIVNSCERTGFMRAFNRSFAQRAVGAKTSAEGWLWWVHQHEDRFREMIAAGLNVRIVWPERMVDGDYEQLQETIEWLGLPWNEEGAKAFIEPKLWKARQIRAAENASGKDGK